jgi:iron complex outermembrane receptor protein
LKYTLFLTLFFSFLTGIAFSQTRTITLINTNHGKTQLLGTASMYSLPDTVLLLSKTISDTAVFTVEANRNYWLKLTAIGAREIRKAFSVKQTALSYNFDWQISTSNLQNVVVTSRKPIVKQEDDKTIIDAEVLANSSTNAYEVLEKTPGAVVDQDGNVYLNSATPAMIQINGREVKLSAADLASLLKSLPATSVIKIEILRNPSAKYDASSTGGIVNIVLKKGVKIGTNGSVNVGFFQGKYHTISSGFNLNRSLGKTNTYLSYQYTDRNNYENLFSSRFSGGGSALVNQNAYTKYPATNNYIGTGVDFQASKKWTIGYDLRFTANKNKSNSLNDIDILSFSTGATQVKNQSLITNAGKTWYMGNNLNTTYKIDSLGSEWELDIDYNLYSNTNDQSYQNNYILPFDSISLGRGDIRGRKNIFVAETDLVIKLKNKYTLETGGKFTYSKSRNNTEYFKDDDGNGFLPDSFQTNKFRYSEQISSAYLQIAKTFFGFTLKPGIRMEHTNISGQQLFPKDTSLSINRTDYFPYVYLRHSIMKLMGFTLTGNLIYRKSIGRPYYEALNPYPKYIDQFLFEVGNPRLRPQFTSNYEFNIVADDFPIFSLGINDIKDIFTSVTYSGTVDSTKVLFRTYDNLGTNREMYLRFVGGIPPGGKYFFYAGAQHNFSNYKGFYQGVPLNYKRGSWTFFMYHNYKPRTDLNISINGFMRLRGLQNFYELNTFGQLNISVNKAVLNKKMNIIVSGNDILRTNKYDFTLNQGINATGSRINDTRRIGLTLRYNFGIKPKEENKQNFEAPVEATN